MILCLLIPTTQTCFEKDSHSVKVELILFFSVKAVLVTAPLQSLLVQVGDIHELTPCNEIFLDEPDKTLYYAFYDRMADVDPAGLTLEITYEDGEMKINVPACGSHVIKLD